MLRGTCLSSEAGTSSIMLLMVWGVLMAFLALSFDFAMAYVYQQQVRTAVEAAVTAGAQQARYKMKVKIYRTRYVEVVEERCTPQPDETAPCVVESVTHWEGHKADLTIGPGWEGETYRPNRPLWEAYPEYCDRYRTHGGHLCSGMEVVKGSCSMQERVPGLAAKEALDAFNLNSDRWQGRLTNVRQVPTPTGAASGMTFQVTMGVEAEMPTMFLRLFGIDTLPIRVRSADLGDSTLGAKAVRLGDDPCTS